MATKDLGIRIFLQGASDFSRDIAHIAMGINNLAKSAERASFSLQGKLAKSVSDLNKKLLQSQIAYEKVGNSIVRLINIKSGLESRYNVLSELINKNSSSLDIENKNLNKLDASHKKYNQSLSLLNSTKRSLQATDVKIATQMKLLAELDGEDEKAIARKVAKIEKLQETREELIIQQGKYKNSVTSLTSKEKEYQQTLDNINRLETSQKKLTTERAKLMKELVSNVDNLGNKQEELARIEKELTDVGGKLSSEQEKLGKSTNGSAEAFAMFGRKVVLAINGISFVMNIGINAVKMFLGVLGSIAGIGIKVASTIFNIGKSILSVPINIIKGAWNLFAKTLGNIFTIALGMNMSRVFWGISQQITGMIKTIFSAASGFQMLEVRLDGLIAREHMQNQTTTDLVLSTRRASAADLARSVILREQIGDLRNQLIHTQYMSDAYLKLEKRINSTTLELNALNIDANGFITTSSNITVRAGTMADSLEKTAGASAKLFDWLAALAVTTPYTGKQISDMFTLAMAYNFSTEEAKKLTLATVEFGIGMGISEEAVGRITENFGQMKAAGKITGTELRDLARGSFVPVSAILNLMGERFGLTGAQVKELGRVGKELDLGKAESEIEGLGEAMSVLPVDAFIDAFIEYTNINFEGATSRMQRTIPTAISNLKDFQEMIIGFKVVKPILDVVGKRLNDFVDILVGQKSRDNMERVGKALEKITELFFILGDVLWKNLKLDSLSSAFGKFVNVIISLAKALGNVFDIVTFMKDSSFGLGRNYFGLSGSTMEDYNKELQGMINKGGTDLFNSMKNLGFSNTLSETARLAILDFYQGFLDVQSGKQTITTFLTDFFADFGPVLNGIYEETLKPTIDTFLLNMWNKLLTLWEDIKVKAPIIWANNILPFLTTIFESAKTWLMNEGKQLLLDGIDEAIKAFDNITLWFSNNIGADSPITKFSKLIKEVFDLVSTGIGGKQVAQDSLGLIPSKSGTGSLDKIRKAIEELGKSILDLANIDMKDINESFDTFIAREESLKRIFGYIYGIVASIVNLGTVITIIFGADNKKKGAGYNFIDFLLALIDVVNATTFGAVFSRLQIFTQTLEDLFRVLSDINTLLKPKPDSKPLGEGQIGSRAFAASDYNTWEELLKGIGDSFEEHMGTDSKASQVSAEFNKNFEASWQYLYDVLVGNSIVPEMMLAISTSIITTLSEIYYQGFYLWFEIIKLYIFTALTIILTYFTTKLEEISTSVTDKMTTVSTTFSTKFGEIKTSFDEKVASLGTLFSTMIDEITAKLDTVDWYKSAGRAFQTLADGAIAELDRIFDKLKEIWAAAANAVINFTGGNSTDKNKSPNGKGGKSYGNTATQDTKPITEATGGFIQAGKTFLTGERGPEMFVPQSSGYMLNTARTERLINSLSQPRQLEARNISNVVHNNQSSVNTTNNNYNVNTSLSNNNFRRISDDIRMLQMLGSA